MIIINLVEKLRGGRGLKSSGVEKNGEINKQYTKCIKTVFQFFIFVIFEYFIIS